MESIFLPIFDQIYDLISQQIHDVEVKHGRKMKVHYTLKQLIAIDNIFGGRPRFKSVFAWVSQNEIKVEN